MGISWKYQVWVGVDADRVFEFEDILKNALELGDSVADWTTLALWDEDHELDHIYSGDDLEGFGVLALNQDAYSGTKPFDVILLSEDIHRIKKDFSDWLKAHGVDYKLAVYSCVCAL